MNEQCIKLRDTFDTRFIKENKDLFYKISKENVNTGKGNNTLMRLIINEKEYAEDRAKMCEFIKGPFSLSKHYNQETNTTIYVFGETHTIVDSCNQLSNNFLGINEFLEQLMAKTNVFLDIYLEVGTEDIFRNNIHKDLKLYLLYDKFKKCINSRTRDNLEECSLSRVHYGDIRNLTFMGKILDLYYHKNNLTADDILNYENGYVLDMINSFSKCKSKADVSAFLKKDFNFNIQNKVLQKEISKCPYGNQIVEFFRSIVVNENLDRYDKLYDTLIKTSIDILTQLKIVKVYKYLEKRLFYTLIQREIHLYLKR